MVVHPLGVNNEGGIAELRQAAHAAAVLRKALCHSICRFT